MKKTLSIISSIIGLILILLAFVYWLTPANSLPSYLPGYDPNLSRIHFKHGLGSFILGLGAFVYAWFKSGKKSAD